MPALTATARPVDAAGDHAGSAAVARSTRTAVCIVLFALALAGLTMSLGARGADPRSGSSLVFERRIDLNTATVGELQLLPRIGPALAQRIADDRDQRGPYTEIEELARVRGIGPKTVEAIRARAVVGPMPVLTGSPPGSAHHADD